MKHSLSRRRASATILSLAAATFGLALACSPHPGSAPPAAAADSGADSARQGTLPPRLELTVADRARWFELLHWPESCEHEFDQTRVADDGGLAFHVLEPGLSLVVVTCALGAYQPTSLVLLLEERGPAPAATTLEFPIFESLDGKTLAPARASELVGEVTVLDSEHALTVLSLARQLGDCGTWARYELRDGAPMLIKFAERVSCPDQPGARANPRPGEPPAGWREMPQT